MKKILVFLIVLFACSFVANAAVEFQLEDDDNAFTDGLTFQVGPSEDENIDLIIKNIGDADLTNVNLAFASFASTDDVDYQLTLEDDENNEVELEIKDHDFSVINPSAEKDVEITIDVDKGFEDSSVSGVIRVTADGGFSQDIPFEVEITPGYCLIGQQGSIDIDIKDPVDGDEFNPGQEVEFEIEVTNDENDDYRIKLEVTLFNEDSMKIEKTFETSQSIDSDEDHIFDFVFNLPDTLDEDDEYTFYVKAYVSNKEEYYCVEDEFDISIEEPEDYVVVNEFTFVTPSAECGELVEGYVNVENKGTNDQTVTLTLKNTELGLNEVVGSIQLGTSSSNDEGIISFMINLPSDAKVTSYPIEAWVEYANGNENVLAKQILSVNTCEVEPDVAEPLSVVVTPQDNTQNTDATSTGNTQTFWDNLTGANSKIPSHVWILVDVLLVVGIVAIIVALLRKKR